MQASLSFSSAADDVAPDAPLTDAYRLLRRVQPPEAPFRGWLARTSDDVTVLLAAVDEVRGWAGLAANPGGHVLGPRDLVRLGVGVCVELDWCPERLDRLLDRRERSGERLHPGEAVTLAVSIGRGLAELATARVRGADAWPEGEWWLTDAARPVFVAGAGGAAADACSYTLWERIAALTADEMVRRAVSRLAEAEEQDRPAAEAALFAAADAAPIAFASFEPARVRSLDVAAALADAPAPASRGRLARLLEQHLDGGIVALLSDAAHATSRRLRGRRPRPWMLAVGAAALVLLVGAVWPTGEPSAATADGDQASAGASPAVTSPAVTSPSVASPSATLSSPPRSPSASAPPDAVGETTALLDAWAACGGEEACIAEVVEDPAAAWVARSVDLPAEGRRVTLLDEFGGVAVLRVTGPDDEATARLVVIVESSGRWLLRDIHEAQR